MENDRVEQENFEVFGLKLKLKKEEMLPGVTPREVVELVQSEAEALLNKYQSISMSQASILAALKIAQDKIALEKQYARNVDYFKTTASEALQLIDEVIPPSNLS